MRKPGRDLGEGTRYDLREVVLRVEKLRKKRRMEVKQLAEAIGLDRFDWSKKINFRGSQFTIPELARIAEVLDAPPGWPFVSEEFWDGLKRSGT